MKVNFRSLFRPLNIFKTLVLIAVGFIIYDLYVGTYDQQILKIRRDKDHYFRTSINSPIPNKDQFEGLNYFPPNERYKVVAKVKQLPGDEKMDIMSSDGRKLTYTKFAIASFQLEGRNFSLLLLKNAHASDGDQLFLPFTDKTNGEATYQGGRYLDVNYTRGKTVVLDFNQAYHPYCLYNYKYSCPVPPAENYLEIEVRAGEKVSNRPVH